MPIPCHNQAQSCNPPPPLFTKLRLQQTHGELGLPQLPQPPARPKRIPFQGVVSNNGESVAGMPLRRLSPFPRLLHRQPRSPTAANV
eukprot:2967809-Amphidinium_carterae.1